MDAHLSQQKSRLVKTISEDDDSSPTYEARKGKPEYPAATVEGDEDEDEGKDDGESNVEASLPLDAIPGEVKSPPDEIPRHTNIYDFPPETLEEIFLHFVSPSQEHSSSSPLVSNYRSRTSPLVVSKICKRWRNIALSSPSLWTHIHVVNPRKISVVQHLKEWMDRAGSLPLCLSLHENWNNPEGCKAVFALFINSLHRCKSFEMNIRTPLEDFGVKEFRMLPSTSLESVKVRCKDSRSDDGEILANLLLRTRTMRTIRWSAALGPLGTISQYWENLRELYISGGSLFEFLDALTRCQNLESLVLREHFTNDGPGAKSVTLPRLTHLSVLVGWSTKIMSLLFLPSLVELEVVPSGELKSGSVLDLMQRSGVMLRRFGIVDENTFSSLPHGGHHGIASSIENAVFQGVEDLGSRGTDDRA